MARVASVVALALATFVGTASAAPDPLGEFLQKYRCAVADRLVRIYDAGDPSSDHDRFLVVEEPDRGYVQCLFHDHETRVLCEASSGFYETKPGETRTAFLRANKRAALARLGFSTDDSAGNFSQDIDLPKRPDFDAIADLILKALYEGYDARLGTALVF